MRVTKRNGESEEFNQQKIYDAIMKSMQHGSGIIKPTIAQNIAEEIKEDFSNKENINISEIETAVFEKLISKKLSIDINLLRFFYLDFCWLE